MHEIHKHQNSRLSVECEPEMIQSRRPQIWKKYVDLSTSNKQAKHVSSYKTNGLTWTATWTEDQCMPCLVWFAFQNSVGITGRCETQIVVLSIIHETQTQNYNVTFFRSFATREQTNKGFWLQNQYIYNVSKNLNKYCGGVVKVCERQLDWCGFESDRVWRRT